MASVFELSIEELVYYEPEKSHINNISSSRSVMKPKVKPTHESIDEVPMEGKGIAITGLVFIIIFITLTIIHSLASISSSFVTMGQTYLFAFIISFITLLPGIILICVAIGIHKFNQVWSNRTLLIASVLFLIFNLKIGIFVFVMAYVVLYKLSKEDILTNK